MFELLTPKEALEAASKFNFAEGALTYILWDITENIEGISARPFYVGTAKNKSRIRNHVNKDKGKAPLARRNNPILADYIEEMATTHGPGWLRFALREHRDFDAAQKDERALIKKWGIKKKGGILFNQIESG